LAVVNARLARRSENAHFVIAVTVGRLILW
jgi:hypothetical protein